MKKVICSLTFALFAITFLSAQAEINVENLEVMSFADDSQRKSCYVDAENKIFFVDFQSLNVNLDVIIVKDEEGNVVKDEKVFDLPVDTIYELNLADLKSGQYAVELRSYGKVIKQSITVK